MARLEARGKFVFDGGRKFFARGVSYGPFPLNSSGERYPEPERACADFALMRELGVNLVRTYTPPPPWLFESAARRGLRLMVGMPWPFHMAFLDSTAMARGIRKTIRDGVGAMRQFGDAIFAYSLGNEIRADIARWHGPRAVSRFLCELRDIGKQLDPEGLFTYSNYPSAEYLDLSFLDLICFNVYLHREADYRRYLTHLLAATGERPLMLSETGIDTIREGEARQAQMLPWQASAASELGLCGFVAFAFTDEWHTGGAEISDWAFGLVRRDRSKKPTFDALGRVFRAPMPPPLKIAPKVSVIVAARNAEATLGECLASLAELNYPNYEMIVVDDGSTDATAEIAAGAHAVLVRLEHSGLGAARNAGVRAAGGEIVAFIDADARADRDWLYHLVETITRRGAAACGGPNFAPPPASAAAGAIAAAPGAPREVRAGDDSLAQFCGCNMAFDKAALLAAGGFDETFTTAGDDVDLSWRMRDRGTALAYASGAVVIHQRRRTARAYLGQQRGYGVGEGLLFRKFPHRRPEALYGGAPRLLLTAGPRIYHGAFGRGLFQTIYAGAQMPAIAELPLTVQWIAAALVLIAAGAVRTPLALLGGVALAISILSACAGAAAARVDPARDGLRARALLAVLCLLGPLLRSFERERLKLSFGGEGGAIGPLQAHGSMRFRAPAAGSGVQSAPVIEQLRAALFRRGLAVAATDGFEPYDLQIVVAPALRVPLNAFFERDGRLAIGWRTALTWWPAAITAVVIFVLLLAAQFPPGSAIGILILLGLVASALALKRLRRLPAILSESATEAAARLGLHAETSGREEA